MTMSGARSSFRISADAECHWPVVGGEAGGGGGAGHAV